MGRSRKRTLGQRVVGLAASGLPAPVRNVASSRWGSRVVLSGAALLFGAGIVTVQWTNGRPELQLDRDRAKEVERRVVEEFRTAGEPDRPADLPTAYLSEVDEPQSTSPNEKFQWIR